jgi:hypothetical protein
VTASVVGTACLSVRLASFELSAIILQSESIVFVPLLTDGEVGSLRGIYVFRAFGEKCDSLFKIPAEDSPMGKCSVNFGHVTTGYCKLLPIRRMDAKILGRCNRVKFAALASILRLTNSTVTADWPTRRDFPSSVVGPGALRLWSEGMIILWYVKLVSKKLF